jgi:undecaprenyl phosphate N,N'-diacetylbacillosamine 1-phosphate transferase
LNKDLYILLFKPAFDFVVSLITFILLLPIFIIVSMLLCISNKGKIFFLQQRPGKGEKIFSIIKFRTMNDRRDEDGNLLPDAERLTAVGKFIRKTSLDEIPQLLNVIKGDMSLVGPRPLLVQYLQLYTQTQRKRHKLRPGITGLAQVNGRNAIKWEDKFEMDVFYIDNVNLKLDLNILIKTIVKVFKSEGINNGRHATMPFFEGGDK